jgi:outer membrane biosynthesis protein TonB
MAALDAAAAAMGVCWRKAPPAKVTVKLAVAADGAVTSTAVSRNAASQCAAGILAVWSLPGGAWSGEIELTPGAPAQDLSSQIQTQLLAQAAPIKACQSHAPTAAGPVQIKMKIHPDGKISDVAVTSSLGAKIDNCVQKAVTAIRIDAIAASSPVTYQLAVAFAGKDADGGGGLPSPAPEGGSIDGTLAVGQVQPVIASARAKLVACGKKGKATGKVVTRFTIRADGTTKNVVTKDAIGDKAIEDCLVGVFKSLTFPTAGGETKVQYPTAFN